MGWLLFIIMFFFMFVGLPIAFSIQAASLGYLLISQSKPLVVVAQKLIIGLDSFPLLAVPLFIMTGYLMEDMGLSKRLVEWVEMMLGRLPGSLGMVTVVTCTIFAALTGSGPATVATIGALMIPAMIKSGYKEEFAAGLVAAGGALGPIIPPSIAMIVYGSTMGVSIPRMFIGGVVPGLLIAAAFIVVNFVLTYQWKLKGIDRHYTPREVLRLTWRALGVLGMPFIVLGGIYGGVFTPTEAATVCVVFSLFLALCYRELTIVKLWHVLVRTAETSASVLFIIASATLFGWLLSVTMLPHRIAEAIVPILHSKAVYLVLLTTVLLIVGCLMDTLAAVVVFAPILVPIGLAMGLDALHLGVVFCVNLIVGFVTPPFGVNLFTAVSISKLPYEKVVKGVLPFMAAAIVIVVLITFVPQLVLWLPNLAMGR